jgi:hypothetical protein
VSRQRAAKTIPPRSDDTTAEAERVQAALIRSAPVAHRLRRALDLSATVIGVARRALARPRPDASKRDLDLLFVELHYGRQLADSLRRDLERRDRRQAGG